MEYCIKNPKYEFPHNEIYEAAEAFAVKNIKEQYEANASDTLDEYLQMKEDGDISSLEEFQNEVDDGYLIEVNGTVEIEPFNKDEYLPLIENKTNEFLRNYYALPQNAVIDLPDKLFSVKVKMQNRRSTKEINVKSGMESEYESKMHEMIAAKYGIDFSSYDAADPASKNEILSAKTFDGINNMLSSSDYATFLALKANILRYSVNNIALIYIQDKNAIDVKGYNSFTADARHVKAGEHGIQIWCPNISKDQTLTTEAMIDKFIAKNYADKPDSYKDDKKADLMKQLKADGKVVIKGYISGYSPGYVFDLKQTVPAVTNEASIDAYVKRNYQDPAERAAAKTDLMARLQTAPKVGKKSEPLLILDHDVYDDAAYLDKPLDANLENYDIIKQAIEQSFKGDGAYVFSGKSESEKLFNAVYDYAKYMFSKCPEQILGIKTNVSEKGVVHSTEVLIAASVICQAIGVDCAQKTSFELAGLLNNEVKDADLFERGRSKIFQIAFDRASCLAKEFIKDFEKNYKELGSPAKDKVYVMEWTDSDGVSDTFTFRKCDSACFDAMKEIQRTDDDSYVAAVKVYEKSEPEKILYQVSKTDADSPVRETFYYPDVVSDIIHTTEFALIRYHDGFGLKDCETANLGNIESKRFTEVSDLLDALDNYVQDYVYKDLSCEARDMLSIDTTGDYGAKDWVAFMNEHEDFKMSHFNDYKACVAMAESFDYPEGLNRLIDLNKIVDAAEYSQEITADSQSYEICSYFDNSYRGLEDSAVTYDWSKVEEFSHEHLMKGGNIEIYEKQTGKSVRLSSDKYVKDFTENGLCEFPVKADYFTDKAENKSKTDIQRKD